jgi:hypothetical protein
MSGRFESFDCVCFVPGIRPTMLAQVSRAGAGRCVTKERKRPSPLFHGRERTRRARFGHHTRETAAPAALSFPLSHPRRLTMGASVAALAGEVAAALIDGRPLAGDFEARLVGALPGTAALTCVFFYYWPACARRAAASSAAGARPLRSTLRLSLSVNEGLTHARVHIEKNQTTGSPWPRGTGRRCSSSPSSVRAAPAAAARALAPPRRCALPPPRRRRRRRLAPSPGRVLARPRTCASRRRSRCGRARAAGGAFFFFSSVGAAPPRRVASVTHPTAPPSHPPHRARPPSTPSHRPHTPARTPPSHYPPPTQQLTGRLC